MCCWRNFCLLLSTLAIALAQSLPSIVQHPEGALVRQGSNHVLRCTATGDDVTIRWSHNGRIVVPDSGRLIFPDNSLQIRMVDSSTVGLYACQATNSLGAVTSQQARLQLAWLVQVNGTNQPTDQKITKAVGETLELNCGEYTSSPVALVSWSKRDSITNIQQTTLGGQTVQSIQTGNLFFRSLTESDSGIFQCVVTNSLTNNGLQGSYQLTVNGTPSEIPTSRAASPPADVTVNVGDTASFQCITAGNPLPNINWTRLVQGDNSISASNIQVSASSFVLSVTNVQRADAGEYICEGSHGVGQLLAHLILRDAPVLTSTPANNPHPVKYGDDLRLNCSANGSLPISLKWYHNGVQLVAGGQVSIERHGELTVRNTSTDVDAGIYQCYAENEAGFASVDIRVDVFTVPPSFTVGLQDKVIFEGDQLLLQCEATGAPPPHYAWYRGNIILGQSNQYDTSVPGTLRMADVSRDQGGMYNCSATSVDNGRLVGRNSSSAMVFVIPPTIFISTPARQLAEQAGNTIILPCVVTADQSTKITYSWTHNGQTVTPNQRIQINNGSLMLTSLQSGDEGRYICVVRTQVMASLSASPRKLYSNVSILSVSEFPVPPGRPVITRIAQLSVILEWPYNGDTRSIGSFQVERRELGIRDWTVVTTIGARAMTQVNASDLYPFTSYQFRVLSINSNGVSSNGEPSDVVTTKEAVPTAAPVNIRVEESNFTAIRVTWEHPPLRLSDGGGRNGIITSYQVIYTPIRGSGVTTTVETGNNNTVITLTGLEHQLVYRVSIAANTSQGRGPVSVVNLPTMGAVTGSEDDKIHTETWFIVLMILIAVVVVGCLVVMAACVVRSVRQNKHSEGKYNVEGIKEGHITTGVLNKDVVQDYENRRTHLMKYTLGNEYRSNASLITDNVTVDGHSNAASTLPAPPYIPPPSFESVGHCSSISTIDRPVVSRGGSSWNNFVIAESDVFDEASSINKPTLDSASDEDDGQNSGSVSTSNKCATFV